MKKICLLALVLVTGAIASGQQPYSHRSLDPTNPLVFGGDHIIFKGEKIVLGPNAFFIEGRFSDAEASEYPYVFNSINKAAEHLTDIDPGNES